MILFAVIATVSIEPSPASLGLSQTVGRGSAVSLDCSRIPTAGRKYSARGETNRVPPGVIPFTCPSTTIRSSFVQYVSRSESSFIPASM